MEAERLMKDQKLLSNVLTEVLGNYGSSPVIATAIRFLLRNPYESVIVVDKNLRIQFMDRASEESFGLAQGGAKGRDIRELIPQSGLPHVVETGLPFIGRIFEVGGRRRIAAVYPLKQHGEIVGAFGKIIFNSIEEIERINSEIQKLKKELHYLKQKEQNEYSSIYTFGDILGKSHLITEAVEIAKKISLLNADVLIIGESGTGKELFAHGIHGYVGVDKPFVRLNCPAIPFDLAESELFGYERGAFTGAVSSGKAGSFEIANNGTIFLDEISSLSLSIQAKLLRVLQEKEIGRLGSTKTRKINFRLITATSTDLRTLINEGKFRDDLYYRIAKAVIQVPALRDRREDIPVYLDHFLDKINQSFNTQIRRISKKALDLLVNYPWPGNVRELINVLEQSVLAASNEKEIAQTHLPQDIVQRSRGMLGKSLRKDTNSIQDAVMRTEKELMLSALTETGGNKRKAARSINMPRSTFYQKLRAYGIGLKV